jgi:drug/metabolite transporter (DMT)-like permease
MTPWILVVGVVVSTIGADLLQSQAMKRHGAVSDFRPRHLSRTWVRMLQMTPIFISVFFMAASFFFFLKLLEISDLSFAVPATAGSIVVETAVARVALGERVTTLRWIGVTLVALGVLLLAGES